MILSIDHIALLKISNPMELRIPAERIEFRERQIGT